MHRLNGWHACCPCTFAPSVCVCVCVCVCVHERMLVFVLVSACACVCILHACAHVHAHAFCMRVCVCVRACVLCMCARACGCAPLKVRPCTDTHTNRHTQTHASLLCLLFSRQAPDLKSTGCEEARLCASLPSGVPGRSGVECGAPVGSALKLP